MTSVEQLGHRRRAQASVSRAATGRDGRFHPATPVADGAPEAGPVDQRVISI